MNFSDDVMVAQTSSQLISGSTFFKILVAVDREDRFAVRNVR